MRCTARAPAPANGAGSAKRSASVGPDRIASLILYEPSAFYLLKQFDEGVGPFAEIRAVADLAATCVATGNERSGAMAFVDYWSGPGAWGALRPAVQDALVRWMPKAPLDFAALFEEPTRWEALTRLKLPTLIIRGERAPPPTRLIADTLPSLLPDCRLAVIAAAGQMGPLTDVAEVNALIADHIDRAVGGVPKAMEAFAFRIKGRSSRVTCARPIPSLPQARSAWLSARANSYKLAVHHLANFLYAAAVRILGIKFYRSNEKPYGISGWGGRAAPSSSWRRQIRSAIRRTLDWSP